MVSTIDLQSSLELESFFIDSTNDPVVDPLTRNTCKSVIGTRDGGFLCLKYLSNHLIIEILQRTSGSSLIRYKQVCKKWHSWINDPDFIKHHFDQAIKDSSINLVVLSTRFLHGSFFVTSIRQQWNAKKDVQHVDQNWKVELLFDYEITKGAFDEDLNMLTCNGLICLYGRRKSHVCNPTTREFITLPDSAPYKVGPCTLGFHAPTMQYKLVQLLHGLSLEDANNILMCEVLNIGSTNPSWKLIVDDRIGRIKLAESPVCVDSMIYWITIDEEDKTCILSFDVGAETFNLIFLPAPLLESDEEVEYIDFHLVGLRNNLCLAERKNKSYMMVIWMLENSVNDLWDVKYYIDVSPIVHLDHEIVPIWIGNGKILFKRVSGLFSYDIKSDKFTQILSNVTWIEAGAYVESLIPILDKDLK